MESSRRIIILLIVGVVVVFGVIAIRSFRGPEEPVVPEKQPTRVVVALHDVAQGSVINVAQDLDLAPIEDDKIEEDHLLEGKINAAELEGAIVRRQLRGGEPVKAGMLTRAGAGGFMSAVLEPGMRAVSIAVSPTSGNAGFISPGDRVDLIVTHRVHTDGSTNNLGGTVVSVTFVHDVRVLAVDQQLENPDNRAILAKTVTVEATPRQAEQITVAGDLGKISVVLRSLAKDAKPAFASQEGGQAAKENSQSVTDLYGNNLALDPQTGKSRFTTDENVSGAMGPNGLAANVRVLHGDRVENVSVR